jgi:hypothetical protein
MPSNNNLILALQYAEQLPPMVSEELQQLIASIQTWANGSSDWIDVPFDVSNFTTNASGSITPLNESPYFYRYVVFNNTMILQVTCKVLVNNGATTEVRIAIPGGYMASQTLLVGDGGSTAGIFSSGSTAGVIGLFTTASHNYVSMQRADGTLAADFPNANCFFRFTLVIPLLK